MSTEYLGEAEDCGNENGYYANEQEMYEDDDEGQVNAFDDAVDLNRKLKMLMNANLSPAELEEQLQLMGLVSQPPSEARRQYQQQRSTAPRQQVRSGRGDIVRAMKAPDAGKTHTKQQAMEIAKNNQHLVQRMQNIKNGPKNSIGGYYTNNRHSAAASHTSSNAINRKKKTTKVQTENEKFYKRLQGVKSTMNSGKIKKDAKRHNEVSKRLSQNSNRNGQRPQKFVQPEWND
jgi:hypothetical protein